MVVTMNPHGEACQVAKLGGVPVDAMLLLNCTTIALTKVKEITELISKSLQADATSRDVGGLIAELSAENER
jgi:exosome complex component RRP45